MEANSEARKSLPKVKRVKRSRKSDHPDVVAARKIAEKQHDAYNRSRMEQLKDSLKSANVQLFDVYDRLREEELEGRIEEVAREGKQHGEAWRIVNEVSGRTSQGKHTGRPREDNGSPTSKTCWETYCD